jgi:hypothetical protein
MKTGNNDRTDTAYATKNSVDIARDDYFNQSNNSITNVYEDTYQNKHNDNLKLNRQNSISNMSQKNKSRKIIDASTMRRTDDLTNTIKADE